MFRLEDTQYTQPRSLLRGQTNLYMLQAYTGDNLSLKTTNLQVLRVTIHVDSEFNKPKTPQNRRPTQYSNSAVL